MNCKSSRAVSLLLNSIPEHSLSDEYALTPHMALRCTIADRAVLMGMKYTDSTERDKKEKEDKGDNGDSGCIAFNRESL
jgi:hypothetical protein